MDFLSDTGHGIRDDIDLDMPPNGDDLSLQDAAEQDASNPPHGSHNQDDFMVDEDLISYSDIELEDVTQLPTDSNFDVQAAREEQITVLDTVPNAATTADNRDFDEDLIDYSDDEKVEDNTQHVGAKTDEDQNSILPPASGEDDQDFAGDAVASADHSNHEEHEYRYEYQVNAMEENNGALEESWNENAPANWEHSSEPDYVENTYTDDQTVNTQTKGTGINQSQHTQDFTETEDDFGAGADDEIQTNNQAQQVPSAGHSLLHPITINYDGSELWLFKPHDSEDDQWLLLDDSIASQQFTYLFRACRDRLGDDVDSETELGLRFDHFYALELYEDCTACAYVTLKDLVDMYLQLHVQDGDSTPEPFYITFQFRPRVLTLVNELRKAAENQMGFSTFSNAVASGKTRFNAFTNSHDETFQEDWTHGEEETDEQGNFGDEITGESVSQLYLGSQTDFGGEGKGSNPSSSRNRANPTDAASTHTSSQNASPSGAVGGEGYEESVIDYSDDEDDNTAKAAQTSQASVNGPSSNSSTVQGNGSHYDQDDNEGLANPTESYKDGGNSESGHDSFEDDIDTHDLDSDIAYTHFEAGNNEHDGHYGEQEFGADDEQGVNLENYEAGGVPQGQDEYYYNGGHNADISQENQFMLSGEADDPSTSVQLDEAEATAADDGLDLLDLDGDDDITEHPPAPGLPDSGIHNQDDEITYDDDDDYGAEAQCSVTAALTAPSAVAPTVGLNDDSSPQGQKRAIDQVVIGSQGADGDTHTKRRKTEPEPQMSLEDDEGDDESIDTFLERLRKETSKARH